jgi:hypothetical protein
MKLPSLRVWYALYLGRRISLTELEVAMMNGTIREPFKHACYIAAHVMTSDDIPLQRLGKNVVSEA